MAAATTLLCILQHHRRPRCPPLLKFRGLPALRQQVVPMSTIWQCPVSVPYRTMFSGDDAHTHAHTPERRAI